MKKKYWWIVGIVILLFIISPFIFYTIFPYYLTGGCRWELEKDYNATVNNKQEAADLINDYYFKVREGWKNITAEDINIIGNEFKYDNWPIKIDNNGKMFWFFCPV